MKRIFIICLLLLALVLSAYAFTSCSNDESGGLKFVSNGDGTCYVSGLEDDSPEEIDIPYTSPKGDKVTAIGPGAFSSADITSAKNSRRPGFGSSNCQLSKS